MIVLGHLDTGSPVVDETDVHCLVADFLAPEDDEQFLQELLWCPAEDAAVDVVETEYE